MSSHRSDLRVIQGSPQRLRPPDDLAPAEKEIFADIVGAVDPKHFAASDLPLLTSYCVAINQEREANRHLRTEGYIIDGKPSPWVVVCRRVVYLPRKAWLRHVAEQKRAVGRCALSGLPHISPLLVRHMFCPPQPPQPCI